MTARSSRDSRDSLPKTFVLDHLATPIGVVLLVTCAGGRVRALDWEGYEPRMHRLLRRHYGAAILVREGRAPAAVRNAIEAYFSGDLNALDSLDVATGGTELQRAVWSELRKIPVGETTTYGEIAARIKRPSAVRAVGAANGANPIGVIVPCHRVIGRDASLTGYAGGLLRKRWLLEHEGALIADRVRVPSTKRASA